MNVIDICSIVAFLCAVGWIIADVIDAIRSVHCEHTADPEVLETVRSVQEELADLCKREGFQEPLDLIKDGVLHFECTKCGEWFTLEEP